MCRCWFVHRHRCCIGAGSVIGIGAASVLGRPSASVLHRCCIGAASVFHRHRCYIGHRHRCCISQGYSFDAALVNGRYQWCLGVSVLGIDGVISWFNVVILQVYCRVVKLTCRLVKLMSYKFYHGIHMCVENVAAQVESNHWASQPLRIWSPHPTPVRFSAAFVAMTKCIKYARHYGTRGSQVIPQLSTSRAQSRLYSEFWWDR